MTPKITSKIVNFFSNLHKTKKSPPYGNCFVCNERVYLPFRCDYCNRLFCGYHHLPFNHNCKNIDEYNKKPLSTGIVTESKDGKLSVRK